MAKKGTFITGMIVGSLVGVTAALLMAPKSGKELRSDLRKWYQAMEKDVNKALAKTQKVTKESYNKMVAEVTKAYEKAKDLAPDDLNQIKKALLAKWDAVQKSAEKESDKVEKKADEVLDKAKRIVRKR